MKNHSLIGLSEAGRWLNWTEGGVERRFADQVVATDQGRFVPVWVVMQEISRFANLANERRLASLEKKVRVLEGEDA